MPGDKAEYRLSPEANRDLEDIWLYTYEHWGLEQANSYIDSLVSQFEELSVNPMQGQQVNLIRQGYRRSIVGRHAIYYQAVINGTLSIHDGPRKLARYNAQGKQVVDKIEVVV